MSAMRNDRNLTQVVFGLAVLAAGLVFMLDNLGVLRARDYLHYWPLVLIGIGVAQIVQARTWSSYSGAVIWMLAGLWFLGRNIGLIRVGLDDIWPLLVAGLGLLLVFRGWHGYDHRARRERGRPTTATLPADIGFDDDGWVTPAPPPPATTNGAPPFTREFPRAALPPPGSEAAGGASPAGSPAATGTRGDRTVNAFVIMGGITRRLATQDFQGGNAIAIMGGAKIDLRQASIAQGDAVIDVLAFWGGVELRVPQDWIIVPQVFPFMGGFEDRTGPPPTGARKRLVVRGLAFMGGVEVKH